MAARAMPSGAAIEVAGQVAVLCLIPQLRDGRRIALSEKMPLQNESNSLSPETQRRHF
jgi:hypothetical protein